MLQYDCWQKMLSLESFGWITSLKTMEIRICVLFYFIFLTYPHKRGWGDSN
jgi:hypothetical protein